MILALFPRHSISAQPENALHFDGTDDYASVSAASSLVSGNTLSMTCWVYLQNTAPSYPNFDGIIGFRNESNCDFYLLQLSTTNFEGRLRNSSGLAYTVTAPGVQTNTWLHLGMTYDGTTLKVYVNGSLSASTPASGSITNTTGNFMLGRLDYQTTQFLLQGRLDEVSLWSKALSASEMQCIALSGIDPNSPGLEVYLEMNQGVAGGNNAGNTTLTGSANSVNAYMYNFGLSGNTSNYVAGIVDYDLTTATICQGEDFPWNGQNYSAPGTYTDTLSGSQGCDSVLRLDLEVISIDTSLSLNGMVLSSNDPTATWQWVDCWNNYAPIPNETNQFLGITGTGSYAVVLTKGICKDTSYCRTFLFTGVQDTPSSLSARVSMGQNQLLFDHESLGRGHLSLCDLSGREWLCRRLDQEERVSLPLEGLRSGLYILTWRPGSGPAQSLKVVVP